MTRILTISYEQSNEDATVMCVAESSLLSTTTTVVKMFTGEKAEKLYKELTGRNQGRKDVEEEALNMAIEALNQECCEDAVSRYEAIYGFNTKQLWVYDEVNNVYIDPPKEVLDEIEKKFDLKTEIDDALYYLETLCNDEEPDWLNDKAYWYDEDTDL